MDGYEEITLLTPRRLRALGVLALAALLCAAGGYAARQVGRARIAEARRELARGAPAARAGLGSPPAAAGDRRSGALLATAASIESTREERTALHRLRRNRPAGWSAAERRWAAGRLDANRAALAALHRTATLSDGLADGRRAGDPPLWELFGAVRLLELGGHAAVVAGDRAEATACVATLARLADLAGRETDLTLQLVALTARGAQLRVLREVVEAGPPPAEIAALAATLAGADHRAAGARAARRAIADRIGEDDAGRTARRIGRRAGPLWHALALFAGELLLAESAGPSLALTRMDRLPYQRVIAEADAAGTALPLGPFAGLGGTETELRGLALRAAKADASAGLARLALALAAAAARDGRYPAALPGGPAATAPDPLTGSLPDYRARPGGGAVVTLAAAEEKTGSAGSLQGLPFVWELPPPR